MTQDEFRALFSGGHLGDKLDFRKRLNDVADFLWKGMSVEEITDDKTLTAEDSNKVFLVGTNGKTITLPATAAGLKYTFINSGADDAVAITLSPQSVDAIMGTIPNAEGDSISGGTDGKDFVNTQGTANKGDRITIIADGSEGWYITEGVGIWASESE
jgi:hypothetical protein